MADEKSKLLNKVSPLIEGQVPDFIQDDHPVFVNFLKQYYQFMEAGQITYTATVNYVTLETTTTAYVLEESDGDRIVTESGSNGSTGKFTNNETITGATSGATATVLVEDSRNGKIFVSSQQKFITGETITGGTSGATGTINEYRANPIQNIQQLLDYADVDNTIYDFLDQMRTSLMTAIPNSLASSVSKRDLIKNIKDLYSAKGTKEGHELFFRILLGEEAEIFYPNIHMLRTSDGDWRTETTLRCTAFQGVTGDEVVNQVITGASSGATATVNNVITFKEGIQSITEFELANIVGTFTDGETITGNSTSRDVDVSFTVSSIVSSTSITNDGILHSDQEVVDLENLGNNEAALIVDGIAKGGVSEVLVDDAGSLYEVGDALTFTTSESDTKSANAFVSMVGGGILQETGTLDDSDITTDAITLEEATQTALQPFNIILETTQSDSFTGDADTKVFTLTNTNGNTDDIKVYLDNIKTDATNSEGSTVWTVSGATLTFTDAPDTSVRILVQGNDIDSLLLDGTDSSSTDAGHNILTDTVVETPDTYSTSTDQIVLEFDTFANLSVSSESGSIQKVFVKDGGAAYTDLPTVTVTSTTGTGTKLLATTTDIGAAESVKIQNTGFNYTIANPPEATLRAHFVLKDVTGTFANANTLTTHTGTVKGWDADTQILDTTFENVVRVEQEQAGTFQDGIQLEQGTTIQGHDGILLEDEQDFDDGVNIILDGTGTTTATARTINFSVYVADDGTGLQNVFYINSVKNPVLTLEEGNTYYFDLSNVSLYNATSTKNHQLKFSITPDGTHGSGVAYTTGVTTSASTIDIGTAGAYVQITVATGAPTLYYYCANHSGMGSSIITPQLPTTIDNEGSAIVLNGESKHEFGIAIESGTFGNSTDLIELEGGEGVIQTEESILNFVQGENDNLLLDRYRENKSAGSQFILLDGINSDGDNAGGVLQSEDFGNVLILDGTDSDQSDIMSGFLLDDQTGDGDIILNGTDSSSTDAGSNIINEDAIDFSNNNVVITDSSGASGTIINADIATTDITVATTSISDGQYFGVDSIIGEDLIRIQDSYYYQQFSYEVRVGASLSTYINELKKAVHPAGFAPFGKVTIATALSAAIKGASGVSGYTGRLPEETFSPILSSTLETLFDQSFQLRLQANNSAIGNSNDRILYESGHVNTDRLTLNATEVNPFIVLDGTDSSSSNAEDRIVLNGTDSITSDAGGFIGMEDFHIPITSTTPAGSSLLLEPFTITNSTAYDYNGTESLAFEQTSAYNEGIELEAGIVMVSGPGNIVINSTVGSDGDAGSQIITEDDSTSAGDVFDLESGSFTNEYDNILLEDDNTISLEDGFIATGDSILYEDAYIVTNQDNGGIMRAETARDAISGQFERSLTHTIVTKISTRPTSRHRKNLFLTLATKPFEHDNPLGGIQMEDVVFIRLEEASALNDPDRNTILLETGGLLVAEKETQRFVYDNIVLNGTRPLRTQYFIVMNGTDSDSSNAGDNIIMENSHATDVARLITETSVTSNAAEDVRNQSDLIIIDDETNDSTLQLSQLAEFQFQDILRKEKLIFEQLASIRHIDYTSNLMLEGEVGGDVPIRLESGTLDDSNITTDSISLEDFTASDGKYMNKSSSNGESSNANAVEAEGIMLEDFGQLQLNGTDSDSSNAGNHILQETDKRNKFDLESNGAIITEDYSTNSRLELIILESGTGATTGHDHIVLEDAVTRDEKIVDGIELEEGTGQNQGDNIILNGTDSDSSNAGFKLKTELSLEVDELKVNPRYMALETTDIITSVGTIPLGNWTLNSISQGYQPVIPSAIITLTDAGDIALEDATDNSGGFLVLNSTSGSSTNAGSMFDLEKGTLNDVLLNSV